MRINLRREFVRYWRTEGRALLVLLLVLFAFRSAIADWNDVPTGSMKPTILEGDRVFVNKLAYDLKVPFTTLRLAQWANPQRGDIVVCYSPADGTRLVKRVVGVPGDRLELRNNRLWVNGEPATYTPLDHSTIRQIDSAERPQHGYARETVQGRSHPVLSTPVWPALRSFDEIVVPDGCYFMMGDNRDNSKDSRYFGVVQREKILGRATAVVLSVDRDDYYLPRRERFFRRLE
jgi:signal peptidase I